MYNINSFTKTPVNSEFLEKILDVPSSTFYSLAVWYAAFLAALLGLLAFAGSSATNALFAVCYFDYFFLCICECLPACGRRE